MPGQLVVEIGFLTAEIAFGLIHHKRVVEAAAPDQPQLLQQLDLMKEAESAAGRDVGGIVGRGVIDRPLHPHHFGMEVDGHLEPRAVERLERDAGVAPPVFKHERLVDYEPFALRILLHQAAGCDRIGIGLRAAVQDRHLFRIQVDEGVVHAHPVQGGKQVFRRDDMHPAGDQRCAATRRSHVGGQRFDYGAGTQIRPVEPDAESDRGGGDPYGGRLARVQADARETERRTEGMLFHPPDLLSDFALRRKIA